MSKEFDKIVEEQGLEGLIPFFPHIFVQDEVSDGDITFIHDKRDGSLISTFLHEDKICVKSKTAIASDQAIAANQILHNDLELYGMVNGLVRADYTVIFEYTSPENRIVLPYQVPELRVLAMRNNRTGGYVPYDELYRLFGDYMVDDHTLTYQGDIDTFIQQIPEMKGIEGFVIGLGSGQRVKIKTDEYFSLHRAKDSIMSDKALFTCVLNDATDDLRSLFHDDEFVLNRIKEMENVAGGAYNTLVAKVERYHADNSTLSRKDYAVKGQQELTKLEFGFAMQLYTGRQPNYKSGMIRKFKQFLGNRDGKDLSYWSES